VTVPPSDDDLRRRVEELGRLEAAGAPRWERVAGARPAGRGAGGAWLRPALAAAAALVVAAGAWWWWPARPGAGPAPRVAASPLADRPAAQARPQVADAGPPAPAAGRAPAGDAPAPTEAAAGDEEEWALPTDGLLGEAWVASSGQRAEVARLSREIEGLLQP
jgi:hypothetical protein